MSIRKPILPWSWEKFWNLSQIMKMSDEAETLTYIFWPKNPNLPTTEKKFKDGISEDF